MTHYAKLINNNPYYLKGVHNISNPTEEQLAIYAAKRGYKQIITSSKPGIYYDEYWSEDENKITNNWVEWDIETAKNDALNRIQNELTNSLSQRVILSCESIPNGIISDNDAIINALSNYRDAEFIVDAADELHPVTDECIQDINNSLAKYRNELYALATYRRTLISNATSIKDIEYALNATPESN